MRIQTFGQVLEQLERERAAERRAERGRLLGACAVAVGDRVRRKSPRGVALMHNVQRADAEGVVEGLVVRDGQVRARVQWQGGQRVFGGGSAYHSTVLVSSLVRVEE